MAEESDLISEVERRKQITCADGSGTVEIGRGIRTVGVTCDGCSVFFPGERHPVENDIVECPRWERHVKDARKEAGLGRIEHERFLVMVRNYWGIGQTVREAMDNAAESGGNFEEGYILLEFPPRTIFQSVHPVTGGVEYMDAGGVDKPEEPKKTIVDPVPAMEQRRTHLRERLLTETGEDEIDWLKNERDDISEWLNEHR
jgi:hypothetical protein